VFLNYVRKSIQTLRRLQEEHLTLSASPPAAAQKLEEFEARKQFLAALAGELLNQDILCLANVAGLKVSGQGPASGRFEFENSTMAFLHGGFLTALRELLGKTFSAFFLAGGSYSQIADFLGQHKNFTRETGEEALAASMLAQLGLGAPPVNTATPPPSPPAPPPPPPQSLQPPARLTPPPPAAPRGSLAGAEPSNPGGDEAIDLSEESDEGEILELDDPIELPDPEVDTTAFMGEADHLQDLNTFDFDPSDKKSILSQEEDALSMSGFKKKTAEAPTADEAPAASKPPEAPAPEASAASKPSEAAPSIGKISPAGEPDASGEQEYTLSPETDESDPFNLDDLEKLLDEENLPG
jgi:hypothetical protein